MKQLDEVKEAYANELGYKDWETCINDQPNYKVEYLMNVVALRLLNKTQNELINALKIYLNAGSKEKRREASIVAKEVINKIEI